MHESKRLRSLPLYLFTVIDDFKAAARAKGTDLIDLGMGNPDLPTSPAIVERLCEGARNPASHRYSRPDNPVEKELREAIASWYQKRFGVDLDPHSEVLPLIGSKEGIIHLALAILDAGDVAIVPTPTYPVHFDSVRLAEGNLQTVQLKREEDYRLNFKNIDSCLARKAKMLLVSYPHNPTAGVVNLAYYQDLVDWARHYQVLVVSDLAYSDIVFDGYRAPSIFQAKGARETAVEFHTLSKSYNMAGWRIGFVVGQAEVLRVLAKLKSYVDFGIFSAIQYAAITALAEEEDWVKPTVEAYRRRRDLLVGGLNRLGWKVDLPKATFYLWAPLPKKYRDKTSLEFTLFLMEETGIVVAPGTGFGEAGEGFVRFALVENEERLRLALERIKEIL